MASLSRVPSSRFPRIGYWFFTPSMLEANRWESLFEDLAKNAPFDFYFLTAREGLDFHDTAPLVPVFTRLVERAHALGLKVGLQLWDPSAPVPDDEASSHVVEGESPLDANGRAEFTLTPRHIRPPHVPFRSVLVSAHVFEKTGEGAYKKSSRVDVTTKTVVEKVDDATLRVKVDLGPSSSGRTAYVMTRHDCRFPAVHGAHVRRAFKATLEAYSSVRFDGAALDEFGALRVTPKWLIDKAGGVFRERAWSRPMADRFSEEHGEPIENALFAMRWNAEGEEAKRAVAINRYMDLVGRGPDDVESWFYGETKRIFGAHAFVGVHNTHHNELPYDEFWVTGNKWWTQKRDFGQTDEHSPLATQLGILLAHPEPILYNMFYDKSADVIADKALGDLPFGIRTHYHAINDAHGWGASLERPEVLRKLVPVERCAELLNHFAPGRPRVRLLTVFGFEALCNWFPNAKNRGRWDLDGSLEIEEKGVALTQAGWHNALVSSDLVGSGVLRLDAKARPFLHEHGFDAMVFLYPQYARESTWAFLERFVERGGKLMLVGEATMDFEGRDVRVRFARLRAKATVAGFDPTAVAKLGLPKDVLPHAGFHEDGSFVHVHPYGSALCDKPEPLAFEVDLGGVRYSGSHAGMVALRGPGHEGKPLFAGYGVLEVLRDGKPWLRFDAPTSLWVDAKGGVHLVGG